MGETQTAIILVTDLVGSTATRSEVGEDAAEELRRRHDAMLTETVERHDGVVVKSLGDGVLARFTAAATAVACASAMQQLVDGRFDIRIGMSAGDVTLEDGDCFGTPVIEASRLCDRAEGGQILVADLVLMLARGRGGHVFESMGALELKGLAGPVPTSQVVWDRSRYNRVRFPDRLRVGGMPFTGRDIALENVRRKSRLVAEGTTQVVLVSGEPGIGKTRLVSEIAMAAHDAGGTVLFGSCRGDGASASGLVTQALTPLVADLPHHVVEAHVEQCGGALAQLVPILASRVPGLEPAGITDGESRSVIYAAVVDLLRRTSELAPVTLVLEDLHCADEDTALQFRRLARTSDLGAVLIVGTYRHTEVHRNQPLGTALADLRRTAGIERVRLRGLGLDDVIGLMAAAGGEELDQRGRELAAVIHRQTDGNPFLIDDALRRLTGSAATFRLARSSRIVLGTVGGISLVVGFAIIGAVIVGDPSGSVLHWLVFIAAAAFSTGVGLWFLLQVNSTVAVGPQGLAFRTSGLRAVTIPWDNIEAIGWRPPPRWIGGSGDFFIETPDGRRLSNPVIKDPTPEFAQTLYGACQRHHINDVALRTKLPKMRG